MKLLLDICQGAGLATAAGVRPFLPVLLAGALASGNLGVDYDHTSYAFLERPGFLLAVVIALIVTVALDRRTGGGSLTEGPLAAAVGGLGIGLGALEFAGSLADNGYTAWPGLVAGVLCAALSNTASRGLLIRTAARLDATARLALPFYAEGIAVLIAGAAVLAPPISLVVLAAFALLLFRGRGAGERKYAGLRILR